MWWWCGSGGGGTGGGGIGGGGTGGGGSKTSNNSRLVIRPTLRAGRDKHVHIVRIFIHLIMCRGLFVLAWLGIR